MIKLFPKINGLAFGILFLLIGATNVSAAPVAQEKVTWVFEYSTISPQNDLAFGYFGESVDGLILSYPSQALCQEGEESYRSDTNYGFHTSRITKSCYQTTQKVYAEKLAASLEAIRTADIGPTALDKFNLWCGLPLPGLSKYNLPDCIPAVVYYVIYKPASWILVGAGQIFDVTLALSIDSSFINQDFVDSTWLVVRDFSNMLFIFILLFAGVQTILNMGAWQNTIKLVIIMALLINFSLFFTKVVIDAGNVLAVGIYNSMGVQKNGTDRNLSGGGVPERNISGNLAGAFEPQRFLDTAGKVDALDATIVFIIAAIVSGFAGYVFFKVALLFIGRLIAFWFLMIVSPFAFISIALPSKANKFQDWVDTLISQAFVAPVFLFLLYLIMQVINGGNGILAGLVKQSGSGVGAFTFDKVLAPVIIATIIIIALQRALKFATDMSGELGNLGAGIGGAALGIATGGTAMVGRTFLGGAGALALRSGLVSSESRVGGFAKTLTKSSFDVRNLGGKDSVFGKTIGGGIAKGVGSLGLGKGGGVGGVEKAKKDQMEKTLEKAKGKEMSIYEEERMRAKAEKEAKKQQTGDNMATARAAFSSKLKEDQAAQLKADVEAAQKAHNESGTAKEVEKTKAAYEESLTGPVDMNARKAAKAAFDTATTTHASSGTSVELQAKLDEMRKAEQEASSATESETPTTTESPTEKPKSANDKINEENERRRNAYADKVAKGGWFGIGANRAAAAKIRSGGDSNHSKKAKELAKELAGLKEEGSGATETQIEYVEKKIEEHKKNK